MAVENDKQESASRRRTVLFGAMAASLAVFVSSPAAEAKDVPLFGIKKKAIEVEEAVVSAAESVVSAAESVESSVAETISELPSVPSLPVPGLAAPVQAGIVLVVDVAAVGVASALVGSLVK